MLADHPVIEVAHTVQEATAAIGWQARGVVEGTLAEWRALHVTVFETINRFHERAREDLSERKFRRPAALSAGAASPQAPARGRERERPSMTWRSR